MASIKKKMTNIKMLMVRMMKIVHIKSLYFLSRSALCITLLFDTVGVPD